MREENDLLLSRIAVRLRHGTTSAILGSGIIYYEPIYKDKVYVFTAAHNLFEDGDNFKRLIPEILIDIYSPVKKIYETISYSTNEDLISADRDKDFGILVLNKDEVDEIAGEIPNIHVVRERGTANGFVIKGFPNATNGEELVKVSPTWLQKMPAVEKFQLQLNEDYSSWATNGFSGSGVFLKTEDELYLFGIFTRYRAEEKGKVIYCQFIGHANEILERNFLPGISFTFFSDHGFTPSFFKTQIETSIKDLGPRFNDILNLKLPIALSFNDLAKDTTFKKRLLKSFDNWLLGKDYSPAGIKEDLISEIEQEFKGIKKFAEQELSGFSWSANEKIDLDPIISKIKGLIENGNLKIDQLYDLQRIELEKEKDKEKKKDYSNNYPLEKELSRVRSINRTNHDLLAGLDEVNVSLSNKPCLLIKGDAGSGKSHLLGDVANERRKKNLPTILLLGQQFRTGQSVWQNILSQLNMRCSKDELLQSLNVIGCQINSRVLILIDAINEGAGKELWPHELSGFMNEVSKFPFIGLALTVRSTYYSQVIPANLKEGQNFIEITHEGFKGNEYEALALFCIHYDLEQPNFPILSPEFSNPLFLQLICEGIKESGQKKFPQGLHGMSAIFNFYLDTICSKLGKKREEYRLRKEMIKNAIYEMAQACFEQEHSRVLPINKAVSLFDAKFPLFRHLLDDLILENVFIQNIRHDYLIDKEVEIVYFAYERFGDFYIASKLLESYDSADAIKIAFQKNKVLGKLLEDAYWRNKGIIEAMAVLLPEKFNLEIIDVFSWVFDESHDNLLGNMDEWLNHFLLDSLKWRTIESIDNKKLTSWIRSGKFKIDDNTWFNFIIELTAQKDHPFNGDRLNENLKRHTMPVRDSFWLDFIRYYSSTFENGSATPLRRLIDWAWQKDISAKIDFETARLTAVTLTWILSSTFKLVRDQATKAMVNLLEEQPDVLIAILKEFKEIDDLYILERLYGVAYGCALRTSRKDSLQKISQYVYDAVFKEGNPPAHVLLRDYARNTIEYALYMKIDLSGDMNLIKPPYNQVMPDVFPSKEDLKIYEGDLNDENYKQWYGREYGQIKFSVMSWDFGRYTVDSILGDFNPVSFTFEEKYKEFINQLVPKKKRVLKAYETQLNYNRKFEVKRGQLAFHMGETKAEELQAIFDYETNRCLETINNLFNEEELLLFSTQIKDHLLAKQKLKDSPYKAFDTEKIKRWIVKRAYDLGYDAKLHGHYDAALANYNNRSENKIERIGKKYQWITFYEVVGIITDNFKIEIERMSGKRKYDFYQGAWQGYLRNVDPAFITKDNEKEDNTEDFKDTELNTTTWWIDKKYDYWTMPVTQWINSTKDLPDPHHLISRKDEQGIEWLYLRTHINWHEPRTVGKDRYAFDRKEIWYLIQGYLVKKKDKQKILSHLNTLDFGGRWMPESHNANVSLYNRENYWSPASKANSLEKWESIKNSTYKFMVATSEAVGELSDDKSGAHFRYEMPCKLIFEGMDLHYAPTDGEFFNKKKELAVINTEYRGTMVRKDFFEKFLEENNLEIVWCILGEKNALGGAISNANLFKTIQGVYSLKSGKVNGLLRLSKRN